MSAPTRSSLRAPCGVCARTRASRSAGPDDAVAVDALQRIGVRQDRDRRAGPIGRLRDRDDDRSRDERPGRVVDQDDARRGGGHACRDRILPAHPTRDDLASPIAHPGTPGDVIDPLGRYDDDRALDEPRDRHGRDGMLEDGATADDRVELVEAAHAAAATGRDDDGVDVGSLHRASVPAARVRRQGAGQG